MTGDTMKSGIGESERLKVEVRQPIHRKRMSKHAQVINGAEVAHSHAAVEESMVMQVNLAAAFHDHISCTKSADLCKMSENREERVTSPCETDHIYATCGDSKQKGYPLLSKDNASEIRRLQEMILLQLDLIQHQQEQLQKKERQLQSLRQEREALKLRLDRMERRVSLLKRKDTESQLEIKSYLQDSKAFTSTAIASSSTQAGTVALPPVGVTRYLGRNSRNIPLRALKRRYFGPQRTFPIKRLTTTSTSSVTSQSSSASDIPDDEFCEERARQYDDDDDDDDYEGTVETVGMVRIPPSPPRFSKKGKILKLKGNKKIESDALEEILKTEMLYYLPQREMSPDIATANETREVPSWRYHPVSSFYQMEGTENIDDKVFYRRHLKYEQDERRRKRWDIQRIREQRISEKLRQGRLGKDLEFGYGKNYRYGMSSFFPEPLNIQYIEVTDVLPVLAFGHPIPLFEPSEFCLPWFSEPEDISEESVKETKEFFDSGEKIT